MTNKEWLKSLPEKMYNMYHTYALMYICQGDLDRYDKWLDDKCKFKISSENKGGKHDKRSKK